MPKIPGDDPLSRVPSMHLSRGEELQTDPDPAALPVPWGWIAVAVVVVVGVLWLV